MEVKTRLSSKKKKNGTKSGGAANKSAKPTAEKIKETEKKAPEVIDEKDIPVQSLSEMLAFAQEAEEMQDAPEQETPKPVEIKIEAPKQEKPKPVEEKKEAPKQENSKPVEEKKEAPKQEAPKPVEEKKEAPKQETPKPAEEKKEAPKPEYRSETGMPLTEEQVKKQAAAEDALDRDLAAARKKKLQEETYLKKQREQERKLEAERLEQAERVRQRHENAAEAAKKMAEQKAAREKAAAALEASQKNAAARAKASVPSNAVQKYHNRQLLSMEAARTLVVLLVIVGLSYIGAHVYVNSLSEGIYEELEAKLLAQSKVVSDSSLEYHMPDSSPLSSELKSQYFLDEGLPDSDLDGLSDYYEINISGTKPRNPDTDDDTVLDGAEVRAGLDPLNPSSDGENPDGTLIRDMVLADKNVSAKIRGAMRTAYTVLSKVDNNSIQGTPGIIGSAYEFYSAKPFDDCELIFTYTDEQLAKNNTPEGALCVFRFDPDKLVFERVASEFNGTNKTVSTHIDSNGIYALCDTSIVMQKHDVNIFFLIDNSGSMYPEELCANSEENDVEFKRLDFAVNLMDMIGTSAKYGAGEFSGNYTNIISITDDYNNVKQKISDIRNKKQTFSGTEIAGAITAAVSEFKSAGRNDKKYLVLLTDGMPSNYNEARERAAIEAAKAANITIFTIGLGKYIDTDYLSNIAQETNGQFFQATNADALENIYGKIRDFMSYNQIVIDETSGEKGYIIADSGFNVQRDGIGYSNFRTDFAPNGADVGIAGLIREYYTGEMNPKEDEFTTDSGESIPGYDISRVEAFLDEKVDLKNIEISALNSYQSFLSIKDKWNYRSIDGGVLHFTESTRDFIDNAGLKTFISQYEFKAPEESAFVKFLRAITFKPLKDFTSYECVLVDSSGFTGDDAAVMSMIKWYNGVVHCSSKSRVYDFGYDGDEAFEVLLDELTTGSPAVIAVGGSAMNAVRLARDVHDPDKFILDAYDCNSPERNTRITIRRTPIYDDPAQIKYQYSASIGTQTMPLRIIVPIDE